MKKIFLLLVLLASLVASGCSLLKQDAPKPVEPKLISFVIYRAAADGSEKLLAERITMPANDKSVAENALIALVSTKPQDAKLEDVIPIGTKVLSFKVDADGVAQANFSKEIVKKGQGSYNELMMTGAIVNTLTEFPEIKKVQILVEGKRVITLGGHIDVEDPLQRNTTLLPK